MLRWVKLQNSTAWSRSCEFWSGEVSTKLKINVLQRSVPSSRTLTFETSSNAPRLRLSNVIESCAVRHIWECVGTFSETYVKKWFWGKKWPENGLNSGFMRFEPFLWEICHKSSLIQKVTEPTEHRSGDSVELFKVWILVEFVEICVKCATFLAVVVGTCEPPIIISPQKSVIWCQKMQNCSGLRNKTQRDTRRWERRKHQKQLLLFSHRHYAWLQPNFRSNSIFNNNDWLNNSGVGDHMLDSMSVKNWDWSLVLNL